METRQSSFRISPQLFIGLIIVFVGVIFTLDNLEIVDAREYLRYWPALLLLIGLAKVFFHRSSGELFWGSILSVVGGVMLLNRLHVFSVDLWDYWPLILVIIGGTMIWNTSRRLSTSGAVLSGNSSTDSDSFLKLFAFMGGFERTNNSQDFRGGELTAIMGGIEIDLRQADMKGGEARLDVFAFWGGVSLKIPEDWSVSIEGIPIMGGIEDKTHPPKGGPAKRLIVTGHVIMGGTEISN